MTNNISLCFAWLVSKFFKPRGVWAEIIYHMRTYPDKWSFNSFLVWNKDSGIGFWTGNSFHGCTLIAVGLEDLAKIPLHSRYELYRCCRECRARQFIMENLK